MISADRHGTGAEQQTQKIRRADGKIMNSLYSVKNLSIHFAGNYVVQDVSFALEKGKIFCLVGESGSGKSLTALSLLKLLPEQAQCTADEFSFCGKDMLHASEKELYALRGKEISMIFQEPMTSLNPVFRASSQIMEVLRYHLKCSKHEAREKCLELCKKVGIPLEKADEFPHKLSGGMRQRIMIAMALACSPKLLIADEPTTALDVTIQGQILNLLKQLVRENDMAMLFITHDLGIVSELADTVGVMYAGELAEIAPAKEFFENPRHPYSKALIQCLPKLGNNPKRLFAIKGTVPKPSGKRSSCAFMERCDYKEKQCTEKQVMLAINEKHGVQCRKFAAVPQLLTGCRECGNEK